MVDGVLANEAMWMLVSFILTFAITRAVVHAIKAGTGPFRDIEAGGVHVHHLVPGIFLLLIGGGGFIALEPAGGAAHLLAVLFGAGGALTLDEFALWLHLKDVYWEEEGRASVDAVVLAAGMLALLAAGSLPFGGPLDFLPAWADVAIYTAQIAFVVFAALKGRYRMALFGVLIPALAWTATFRLARPNSVWANKRYPAGSAKLVRAARRYAGHGRRTAHLLRKIGGGAGGA